MRRRFIAPLVAATLALGIVAGAAGTIVAQQPTATSTTMAHHMEGLDMDAMHASDSMAEHMAGLDMDAMHSMMVEMMGAPMPGASAMPGDAQNHDAHHQPAATPVR